VSLLLFADDSLILFSANGGDTQELIRILGVYEEFSRRL
jgi:hypothetical protein